jgi:hypothetical protein
MKGALLEIFLRREGADQFSSYGEVAAERQTDIIRQLAQPVDPDPQFEEILKQLVRATKRTAA